MINDEMGIESAKLKKAFENSHNYGYNSNTKSYEKVV